MIRKISRSKVLLLAICCNAFSISLFGQWSTSNLSSARYPAAASAGTFAVFAGGADGTGNPSTTVDIYNNSNGFWTPEVLPGPKSSMAGASLGTKVYFAGGLGLGGPSDVVDIYDVISEGWTSATLSEARFDLTSATSGTRVFFAGGFSLVAASNTVDIYNSGTGLWTTAVLSVPRASLAAAAAGTKVLFAGGYDLDPDTFEQVYSNVVDIYDTGTGTWTTATLSQARAYLVAAAVGTKIFFAGGSFSPGALSNVVDIYDTSTGTWSTATLSQARSGMAAASAGSKVIFAGGFGLSGNSKVVDIYDNSTGTWTTSTLSVARNSLAGTSVGSKALFAGGYNNGVSSIVDLYDASCNSTILTITPPVSICFGESVNLTVSGGSNYMWSPAAGLSQTTGASVMASPTTTTTYLVVDAGLNACASVTVTVGSPVAFSFVPPTQTICVGKSTRLVVSGPPDLSWSPSTGLSATSGSTVYASPSVTTTYTVTGSDGGGCVVTADITVIVDNCTGLTTSTLVQNRWDLAATTVGTKAIFAGGTVFGSSMDFEPTNYSTAVDIYDNASGTWSSATLSRGRTELAAATAGTKALFAGGRHEGGTFNVTSSDVVDIYNNSTGTWSTANLSEARHQLAAASVGTKAFFAGGFSYENGYTSAVDIYDNATGMWTTASLSSPRASLTATSVGTKVFFAGGIGPGGVYSDVVDIYDNGTDMWSTATLSQARQYLASTIVGTKVLFGGGRLTGDVQSTLVDIYDNSTDTWSTATLSEARDFLAATSSGTMAFFAGGYIGGDFTNTIDIYEESTDTWTTGVLSVDRSSMGATSVGNKVIFAGGLGLNTMADGLVVDMYDVNCINNQVGVTASLNLCQGSSTILTATDAISYTWSPATGLSATTGSSVTANPTSTQTYIVTGNHGGGCLTTASVTVTVIAAPTVTATPSHTICIGSSTNLVASGASTYVWSPGTDLSATTGSSVIATPTSTITYTVVGTAANGCTNTDDVTVTVNPLPTITVSPSTNICAGASTNLVASGGVSYTWSPAAGLSATTGASVTATPAITTIYTVTGLDAIGCAGEANVAVTIDPAPNVTVTPSPSICAGGNTTLVAAGALTYTWSPAAGLSATTGTSVIASPSVTTTYTVSGDDGVSSCLGIATTTVTVFPDVVDVTPSMTICAGEIRTLTATGATTYTWSPASGLSATTGSSVQANPTTTTTYTVTGNYGPGCSGQASVTVTVNPSPNVTVAPTAITLCSGSTVDLVANGGVSYSWSPVAGLSSSTGATVTVNSLVTRTYTVTGLGANGCPGTAISVVTIIPIPTKPVITVTPAGSGHFILTSSAASGNQWFRNGTLVLGATNQTLDVTLANEGTYTVISTQGSCVSPSSDPVPVFITGFEESLSVRPLLVHPNPAEEYLQVQWNDSDADNAIDASIVDQTGRPVISQQLPPQGGRVDLRGLAPGLYLLQATQGNSSKVQKFVKR